MACWALAIGRLAGLQGIMLLVAGLIESLPRRLLVELFVAAGLLDIGLIASLLTFWLADGQLALFLIAGLNAGLYSGLAAGQLAGLIVLLLDGGLLGGRAAGLALRRLNVLLTVGLSAGVLRGLVGGAGCWACCWETGGAACIAACRCTGCWDCC